jgi:cytochrome c
MTSTLLFRLLSPFATAAVLLAPAAVAQAAAPAALTGNAEAGKAAFRKCASCHQVGPSARGGFGPKLTGVIGRKAGATTDYKYSAAMKNANIVWTEQNLAAFLKAPSDFIPGNNMRFWGIGNAQQVADLLAYLRTQ